MTEINIENIVLSSDGKEATADEIETLRQQAKTVYKEYKRLYNAKRYEEKQEHLKKQASILYFKKVEQNPEYRKVLTERERNRKIKILKEQGKELRPNRGRPKKEQEEPKEKKPTGRPSLHF